MNEEQQVKLKELIEELNSLATPELVREACKVVALHSPPDQFRSRMKAAMDAAISAQLLHAYLQVVREVEDWRISLGEKAHQDKTQAEHLIPDSIEQAVTLAVRASKWVGEQDVIRHFWVIAVGRIQRLLETLARQAGFKISPEDLQLLETYRDMRDYYEHLEGELPGSKSKKKQSKDALQDDTRIVFGLEMDEDGRTMLGEKRVDITGRGLQRVEELAERVYYGSRSSAIEKVQKYYQKHPDSIPPVDVVDSTPIVSIHLPGFE